MGITLSRGGTSITLTDDLDVSRSVGRPKAELRPVPDENYPKYIDKKRAAEDVFEISGQFTSSRAERDKRLLVNDIIVPQLGRNSLTLSFDNSLFGLGSYNVFPSGSRAVRVSYRTGETGVVIVDTLELRVVNNG
jgi:hypothetical protein